ncbi:MAG TPA: hypothetical protein VGX23_29500 [Actinocrinis sp.]|nr:hypothetical protein [Actinocrinis sp.]
MHRADAAAIGATAVLAVAAAIASAVVTLLVGASGVSLVGISSPFWGLAAGLGMLALRYRKPPPATEPASASE